MGMNKGLLYILLLTLFGSLNMWSEEAVISFDLGFSLLCPEGWSYKLDDLPKEMTLPEFNLLTKNESETGALPAITLYNYDYNSLDLAKSPDYLKKFPLKVYRGSDEKIDLFIEQFINELHSQHAEPIPVKEVITESSLLAGHNVYICRITYSSNVTILTIFIEAEQFILEFTQYIELNKDRPQSAESINYLSPFTPDSDLITIIKGLTLKHPRRPALFSPVVDLRMREEPGLHGRFMRYLAVEEKLLVLEVGPAAVIAGLKGHWVRVKTSSNEEGWCFNGYLKEVR